METHQMYMFDADLKMETKYDFMKKDFPNETFVKRIIIRCL